METAFSIYVDRLIQLLFFSFFMYYSLTVCSFIEKALYYYDRDLPSKDRLIDRNRHSR